MWFLVGMVWGVLPAKATSWADLEPDYSLSDSSDEVDERTVLATSAPLPFRKRSGSPLVLGSRAFSFSPTRNAPVDPLPGTEVGDRYHRLVQSCKAGVVDDQFREDMGKSSFLINYSPLSKSMVETNKTLLYYVIAKDDGSFTNLKSRLRMMKMLMLKKASLDLVINPGHDGEGDSFLTVACLKSHEDVVSLLLEKGLCTDFTDYNNWNVFHFAAANVYRSRQVLELLFEKIGDKGINDKTNSHQTPLDIAIERGHHDAKDYLESIGAKKFEDKN